MKPDISVIIPFLNEAENIENLVHSLNNYFAEATYKTEILFVNDGSTDDSLVRLRNQKHVNYQCKIISLSKNYGSHAALRAGIYESGGNYTTFMYADLQDPLNLINLLKAKIEEGNDIVWAHRNSTKVSFSEKTFSLFYSYMMKKFALPNYPEKGFDVVMFNRKIANELNKNIEKNSSIFLQILGMGFIQSSISYNKNPRNAGKSKWTLSKKIKLFIDSFIAFSFAPIRFVTLVGIALFFLGILWTTYIGLRAVFFRDLNQGWPSLIAILTIGFGITNISLGIIAEYLWRTLDSSRNRPVYIVNEIIELKNEP